MEQPDRRREAFTLVEILIVIAIIAVLASLGLRPMLRAKRASQESAAMQVLRSLQKAEVQHKMRFGVYGDLNALLLMGASPVEEGGVEPASGYVFSSDAGAEGYTIVAVPPKPEMRTYTLFDGGAISGE